jgi:protein-L-isoaspartate(D-aspartate) O-methyltransferase
MDFTQLRITMVETQLRTNRVSNAGVVDAFADVPRENFVPKAARTMAYMDEDQSFEDGTYLQEPRVFGRMVQEANIQENDLILDIHSTSGYSAAVLAKLGATVVALNADPALTEKAKANLADLSIDNVIPVTGALAEGDKENGPYDVIFIQGSAQQVPQALFDQLAEGGRLLVTMLDKNNLGRTTIYTKNDGVVGHVGLFDAAAKCLPGFETKKQFVFS